MEQFCQSCAMPLTEESLGTEKEGSRSQEYCSYCYEKGEFSAPGISMEEMIGFCVAPMVENVPGLTEEAARNMMNQSFPSLKRWKKA